MVNFLRKTHARTIKANPLKNGDAKLEGLTDLLKSYVSQLSNTTETSVCFRTEVFFLRYLKFELVIVGAFSFVYR